MRLPARSGVRLSAPSGDRRLADPNRQAAALAQGGVVLSPVGHLVAPLGDAVVARGVGLERHGRSSRIVDAAAPYATHPVMPTKPELIWLFKICETCFSGPSLGEEAGMASATEFRALARVERDPRKRVRLLGRLPTSARG